MAAAESDRRDLAGWSTTCAVCLRCATAGIDVALAEFDQAIALRRRPRSPTTEQPSLFLNRGGVHLLRRDLRAARDDLSASARLAGRVGMTRLESKAEHNLGYAEYLAGDLPAALRHPRARCTPWTRRARAGLVPRPGSGPHRGRAARRGRRGARQCLHELLRRERANQDRAEAELARAEVALLQGDSTWPSDPLGARPPDFRRRQSPGWQARADVTRWQAYLGSKGGPARVAREIRSAVAASDEATSTDSSPSSPPRRASRWTRRRRRHPAGAGPSQGRRPTPSAGGSTSTWSGPGSRARPATSRRRSASCGPGCARSANQQARHHSLDLRTAMAVHGGRLAELDLRIALESGLRAVGLHLARAVAGHVAPPHRGHARRATGSWPTSCRGLRIVTEESGTARRGGRSSTCGDGSARSSGRSGSASGGCRATVGPSGTPRSPTSSRCSTSRTPRSSPTSCSTTASAPSRSAGGRPRVVTLGPWAEVAALMTRVRADLDALAGRMLPAAAAPGGLGLPAHDLDKLDRLLLPNPLTDAGSLLVIPSRTLATAPWSLLPRRVGRPTTVALSATSWLRGRTAPIPSPRVTALAGPGLALSGPEVQDVAATWPGGVAADSEHGSAAALATALVTSDLVHIAAHGQHNQDNPLFSSIRMADGPLYAYDVPPDEPVAGHIVLSACDLGLTTPRAGGEVLGLTAALLSIGATSVVSSVSRVDDTTAYETMLRYHRLLAAGLDSPTALAEALDGDVDMPAPFVCFGSPWSVAR